MLPEPNKGLCGSRIGMPRRQRDLINGYLGTGDRSRQTVGHNLFNSLIDWWPLTEPAPIANAWVGVHNNIQLTGGVTGQVVGNGPTFAMNNIAGLGGVHCASRSDLQISAGLSFSLVCWFKLTAGFAVGGLMTKDDAGVQREFAFYISNIAPNGTISFRIGTGAGFFPGGLLSSTAGAVVAGTWYCAIAVYDATAPLQTIYLNGTTYTAIPTTVPGISAAQFWLAGDQRGAGFAMSGALQRCGRWNRALSASEMSYLYNGGVGRDYPFI
jgi:hypothetical protein